jgi:hypothetical protein
MVIRNAVLVRVIVIVLGSNRALRIQSDYDYEHRFALDRMGLRAKLSTSTKEN